MRNQIYIDGKHEGEQIVETKGKRKKKKKTTTQIWVQEAVFCLSYFT